MANSTINTYQSFLVKFFEWSKEDSCRITEDAIQEYMLEIPEHYSNSYRNQAVNAIRLYFIIVERRKFKKVVLPRPKKDQYIPNVLSPDQIRAIIFNTQNIKHRAILYTIYHSGLRISEAIRLKWGDLKPYDVCQHIIIRNTKNHSSRTIPVKEEYMTLMKEYWLNLRAAHIPRQNTDYVFQGEGGGMYSKTSIRNILNNALEREGVFVPIRVHDLRHSFATHCLAANTNIHHLSNILGHKSVKTTESVYAHLRFNQLQIRRMV